MSPSSADGSLRPSSSKIAASNADCCAGVASRRLSVTIATSWAVVFIWHVEEIWEQYRAYYASQYQRPAIELSAPAQAAIRRHPWPGNVRELENCVRFLTCLQLARPIEPTDLPFAGAATTTAPDGHGAANGSGSAGKVNGSNGIHLPAMTGVAGGGAHADFRSAKAAMVGEFERSLVQSALDDSKGNIAQAARSVGKPRRTFFALMRRHNISPRRMG